MYAKRRTGRRKEVSVSILCEKSTLLSIYVGQTIQKSYALSRRETNPRKLWPLEAPCGVEQHGTPPPPVGPCWREIERRASTLCTRERANGGRTHASRGRLD